MGRDKHAHRWTGAVIALTSAALFGASTPLAKLFVGDVDPWMLAALLYLGSGSGLFFFRILRSTATDDVSPPVKGASWYWLLAAIFFGGVVGPVLLMFGLIDTLASSASLLLNLEGVLTALLAWFVFKENFDRRVALGMFAIAAGAALISWQGTWDWKDLAGPLSVVGACLAWAIDNNLTRRVSLSDPTQIAMLKGICAGSVNLVIALLLNASLPDPRLVLAIAVVGLVGYGISLVLFVVALRHLGTARTGAYYSTAPFVGAVVAILALGESVSLQLALAAGLMAIGVWLHLTEDHVHEHEHVALTHDHWHRHDEHHQHAHDGGATSVGGHNHPHSHPPLRHKHRHYPDAHHHHLH